MSSCSTHRALRTALLSTAALAFAGAGSAIAIAADGSDTALSVSPRIVTAAPQRSPADFPGVSQARAGSPLPAGYVVVARDVRFTRGAEAAYAALRMTCPRGRTWRTGAVTGDIGLTVLDRTVSKKRSVLVMATYDTNTTALGQTAAGTVYALCR